MMPTGNVVILHKEVESQEQNFDGSRKTKQVS